MSALDAALATIPADAHPKHYGHAWGLMHGYDAVYRNQTLRPVAVETEFKVPIYNLQGKRVSQSKTLELAGVLDVLAVEDGKQWVLDHKTSSDDLGPESPYWQQLVVEGQASLYPLACHLQGIEVAGAVWDVLRKPGIKPKAIPEKERAGISVLPHHYHGFVCSRASVDYAVNGGKGVQENAELFGYRCARECLNKPDRYFAQRKVFKLESDLTEFAGELWDVSQDITQVRRTGRHYRNSGACKLYGRACEYLGICSGFDKPDSAKWQQRESVHPELRGCGNGRDVLTHTRMRCFQTCRRKHYYRYELGIERVQEETPEALYFGTMIHRALEAWWKTFLPQGENNGDSDQAAGSGPENV